MQTLKFENFRQSATGRLVSHTAMISIVFSRNPYGSHNLVLVDDCGEAFRHGNEAVLEYLQSYPALWRKAKRFLALRVSREVLVAKTFTEKYPVSNVKRISK